MVANLKRIRKQLGMTQYELSRITNIHRVTIAKYEAGKVDPTLESAEKLASALGVTVDELIDNKKKVG